jgi:hypothetical protein
MTPIDPSGFLRGAILACASSPPSKTAAEARPDVWYTDAYGRSGRTEPFPGSIRQRIASVGNDIGVDVNGPTIGQNRSYSGGGVRAPN